MRKLLLFPVFLIMLTALFSCSKSAPNTSSDESLDLNTFEAATFCYEEKYLQSQSDEDLKELCDQLTILPWKEKQLRQMVLKYYPKFFEKYDPDEAEDTNRSFDAYYQVYVYAYKAEGGELIPVYNQYKEKADNVYGYARSIYSWVLSLDNITAEEYDFLYDEAYRLYWAARDNVEPFLNIAHAYGCVCDICEALGKEINPSVREDLEEYSAEVQKNL